MGRRRKSLRFVVELDILPGEIKKKDGTSVQVETYMLRLNGKAVRTMKDMRVNGNEAYLKAIRDYTTQYLKNDLHTFLRHHSMEAGWCGLLADDFPPVVKRRIKLAARRLAEVFSRDERYKWSARLGARGPVGGRDQKWTPERRTEFLELYEGILKQIQDRSPELPEEVISELRFRGVKPSDLARDYAAKLFKVPANEYLARVLTNARRDRRVRRTMKRRR